MGEICPFTDSDGCWVFCHDGYPSSDEFEGNGEHICKAWGCIGYNIKQEPVMGCKLIERGYK